MSQMESGNANDSSHLLRHLISAGAAFLLLGACGGGGDSPTAPGPTTPEFIYSKHRNLSSGQITPVLSESGSGFDAREVDSPSVVVANGRPAGDKFMLYYEASDDQGRSTIGLVTSDEEDLDPIVLARTIVIDRGTSGSAYETAATDPAVIVDVRPAEASRRYKMWFEGRSGSNGEVSTIIFVTSADGVSWTGFQNCIGLTPSFGSVRVADPSVTLDGDIYRMWFEAVDSSTSGSDGPGAIGYAESMDGVHWTITDAAGNQGTSASAVFARGSSGAFDGYSVNSPCVVIDDAFASGAEGRFKLWYEAGDTAGDTQNSIGYATSGDGLSWTRRALPLLNPSSDSLVPLPFDSGDLEHPTAVIRQSVPNTLEGHFLLWYTGDGEGSVSPNRIGLARGAVSP